jgi:hypothetical protein
MHGLLPYDKTANILTRKYKGAVGGGSPTVEGAKTFGFCIGVCQRQTPGVLNGWNLRTFGSAQQKLQGELQAVHPTSSLI